MKTTLDIQRRLKELGYDPGPLDNIRGRQTIAAVERYQRANHLTVNGLIDPQTYRALFGGATIAEQESPDATPWLAEALRLLGVRETPGKGSSPVILDWAEKLDLDYPNDDVPWCGLFVAHCVAASLPREPLPANPLGARNWASFGKACDVVDGAIASFWRGSKSGWLGHVGIVTGQTASTIEIVGGNQSDRVSKIQMPRARLLATRWPATALISSHITSGSDAAMTNGNEA